jgi:hypothetical protein
MNFASVQKDPRRAEHVVGYDQLRRDLAANTLPNFGLIIPNLCNDMHGMAGPKVPDDCLFEHMDAAMAKVVAMIQGSAAWKSDDNVAIVVTRTKRRPHARRLLRRDAERAVERRRRTHRHDRDHEPRPARRGRPHALQPLLSPPHDRGRLRNPRLPRPRRRK